MRVFYFTLLISQSKKAFSAPCTTNGATVETTGTCCTESTGTWAQCLFNCNSKGKDLACPSDLEDNNAIGAECGFGWIGLNDLNTEMIFQCAAEAVPYAHWLAPEPNNAGGIEHCANNGNAQSGYWNDENCDAVKTCICKDKPEPPETFSGCSKQGSGTWDQCKANCEAEGQMLACPSDTADNAAILNQCGSGWIGVNDQETEDAFMCNGEAASFLNWKSSEPNEENGGENCIENDDGLWNDAVCSGVKDCICQPAPAPPGDAGSCFHASGAATLESGASKKMSELSLGDVVQIADEEGKLSFSQILLLPHKKNNELATFLNLTTESGKTTLMTLDHLIPRCGETVILSMASELLVGDCLLTVDGKETLTEITSVVANGIYTAVTKAKFIVVDSIVASPFSRDSDRDHSMREYEELRIVLEQEQKLELDKAERKHQSTAAKRLDAGN